VRWSGLASTAMRSSSCTSARTVLSRSLATSGRHPATLASIPPIWDTSRRVHCTGARGRRPRSGRSFLVSGWAPSTGSRKRARQGRCGRAPRWHEPSGWPSSLGASRSTGPSDTPQSGSALVRGPGVDRRTVPTRQLPHSPPSQREHHPAGEHGCVGRVRPMIPTTASALPEDVDTLLRTLRLLHIRRAAPEVIATAKAQRWDPGELLRALLSEERRGRDRSAISMRRSHAGFPTGKTFAAWHDE
jgi:hypothetical protein